MGFRQSTLRERQFFFVVDRVKMKVVLAARCTRKARDATAGETGTDCDSQTSFDVGICVLLTICKDFLQ